MSLPVVLDREPTEIWANVSSQWNRSLSDFPASAGWQLSYTLTAPTGGAIALAWAAEVTASGDEFAINCPASKTVSVVAAGPGRLQGKISKATDSAIIYDAAITWRIVGGLSYAQTILAAVDAMLLGNASREERQLSITQPSGTSKALELCSKTDLLALREYWRAILAAETDAERAAHGLGSRRIIRNRYRNP